MAGEGGEPPPVSLEGVVARAEGEASEGGSPFEPAASRRSGIVLRSAVTVGDAAPRGGPSDGAERAEPDGEEVDAPAVRDGLRNPPVRRGHERRGKPLEESGIVRLVEPQPGEDGGEGGGGLPRAHVDGVLAGPCLVRRAGTRPRVKLPRRAAGREVPLICGRSGAKPTPSGIWGSRNDEALALRAGVGRLGPGGDASAGRGRQRGGGAGGLVLARRRGRSGWG